MVEIGKIYSFCVQVDIIWYQEVDDYAQSGFYILKTFLSLEIVVALVEIILRLMKFSTKLITKNNNLSLV